MTQQKRDILHVTLEGNDEWQPTIEDMQAVQEMFLSAARDPKGGIIVTRQGIEVELDIADVQEGEEFDLVSVTVANAFLDQVEEEADPDEVVEMFPVGRIEGHTLYCAYDEDISTEVDAEYIAKYPLNQKGFYVMFADGREDFLVTAKREH